MKQNRNKITALLAASILLVSCSTAPEQTVDPVETVQTQTETTAVTETGPRPDIPDVTYEGQEFRIMYRYGAHAYNIEDIWVESQNGEIINDTVVARNRDVEETFGITIIPMPEISPVAQLKANVLAADEFCELLADRCFELFPLTMENYTYDLNQLQYLDFSKPWWDSNAVEQLSVGDHSYIMVGDFNISSTFGATFLWFNKKLLSEYGFDMPYEMASNGTWTIDKMLEMVNTVSADLNGDGALNSQDRYGFLTQVPYRLTTGFGIQLTERNEENIPELAPMNNRLVDAMQIVTDLMKDEEHTISYERMAHGQDTSSYPHIFAFGRSKFVTDQILFLEAGIYFADEIREMESPYGILPMPKLDENQERYYHLVDEYSNGWVIPATSTKADMTSIVLEYMAYASAPLVDAVYETTLKVKRMDSNDDAVMLDMIRETTWYEITFVMDVGIRQMLESAVKSGNVASEYAKKRKEHPQKNERICK